MQICPDRIISSVYATCYILINKPNYLHGPFPSVKAQINREDVQFRGQGTENSGSSSSSSSSSSDRISSNSTVIPKMHLSLFFKTSDISYLLGTGRVWNS